jgi:uncharacterized protein (TIRG00374 family)
VTLKNLRGKFILSLLLGVAVLVGLTAYGDFSEVASAIGDFRWELLPAILALTLVNYLLRFVKWHFYLGQIGVRGLSKWNSFLMFFSGLAMVVTPGKVGEWLKSYLLREVHGTPFARSAPILIAERFTDAIALLLLATAGLILFGEAWQFFLVVGVGAVVLLALARHRPTMRLILRTAGRLPVVSRFTHLLEEFYESTHVLFAPRSLILTTLLSVVSWMGEVLAFYLVLVGLGLDATGLLFVQAAFILPVATVAGAVLLTPGGLGVTEGGVTGLLQVIVDMEKGPAAVATLLIRFATLWFGVFVGLAALVPMTRRLAAAPAVELEAAPASWADATRQEGQAWAADPNPLSPDSGRRRSQ